MRRHRSSTESSKRFCTHSDLSSQKGEGEMVDLYIAVKRLCEKLGHDFGEWSEWYPSGDDERQRHRKCPTCGTVDYHVDAGTAEPTEEGSGEG